MAEVHLCRKAIREGSRLEHGRPCFQQVDELAAKLVVTGSPASSAGGGLGNPSFGAEARDLISGDQLGPFVHVVFIEASRQVGIPVVQK